jgi:hypothetical protein
MKVCTTHITGECNKLHTDARSPAITSFRNHLFIHIEQAALSMHSALTGLNEVEARDSRR